MTTRICIVFDPDWEEYSFDSGDGSEAQRYRTPDKDNAIGTARAVYGADVQITHRMKRSKLSQSKSAPEWVKRAGAIWDEMECNPPSAEKLAPFRTKNWIDKGKSMLEGLKPRRSKKEST